MKAANEYEYLKQSDCLRINDVDDAQRFHDLMVFHSPLLLQETLLSAFLLCMMLNDFSLPILFPLVVS